jgi:hypothetical protein
MYTYDKPLRITYQFAAAAIDTDALIGTFIGPPGKVGRIVSCTVALTAAVTVAAAGIEIGIAANGTENLSFDVPILAINLGHSATAAEIAAGADIIADAVTYVGADGDANAGDGDITIVVDWY